MLARRLHPSRRLEASIARECIFCRAQLARNFHNNPILRDGEKSTPTTSTQQSPSIKTGASRQRAAQASQSIQKIRNPAGPVGLRGGMFRSGPMPEGQQPRPSRARPERPAAAPRHQDENDFEPSPRDAAAPESERSADEANRNFQIRKTYNPGPRPSREPSTSTDPPAPRNTSDVSPRPTFRITRTLVGPSTAPERPQRGPREDSRRPRRPRASGPRPQRNNRATDEDEKEMSKYYAAPHKFDEDLTMPQKLVEMGVIDKPEFTPLDMKQEKLVTDRISMAAGEDGLRTEVVSAMARLARRPNLDWTVDADLARRLCHGEVIKFTSGEERERIVRKAEMFAERTAEKISVRKGTKVEKEDVGFVPVGGEMRERIVDKVLKGRYEMMQREEKVTGREATINQVEAALKINGTYTPGKSSQVLDMVRKLWPAGAPA